MTNLSDIPTNEHRPQDGAEWEDSPFSLLEPVARAELLESQLLAAIHAQSKEDVVTATSDWDDMGCYFHDE